MKRWSKALLFTAAAAAAAVLIGCEPVSGGGGSTVPAGPGVESVTVSQTAITLEVGSTYTLTASVLPAEMDTGVSWKSSDQSVVTVTKGKITALKAGTADVTAMANADTSKTAVCKVTVVDQGEGTQPTNITLSKTVLNLGFGETALLSVNVSPDDAVMPVLTWSSSDNTVVKVADGQVTGIGEGTATVTVSAGILSASCDVTVTRSGIEGDWQTGWNRYVITADTITTYYKENDVESDWVPGTQYVYSDKTGNEISGTVTVTVQSMWDEDNNKWQTVDDAVTVQMDLIKQALNQSLRECIKLIDGENLTDDEVKLKSFIAGLKGIADEMDMTFNEGNLTVENLDKPVPDDVKELYTAYAEKMFAIQKEEMKKPCTYTYTVTDDGWDGTMIQFSGAYDTSKKWFEQTNGRFESYDNGYNITYYPNNKELYMWNGATATENSIDFSSVTETSLTERDSGEEWIASWNGTVLTLTDPDDSSYTLEWSGYSL